MPSSRRIKVTVIFILFAIIVSIYVSTSASTTRGDKFYKSTQDALLSYRRGQDAKGKSLLNADKPVQQRLSEAADQARKAAEEKAAEFHGPEIMEHGQKVLPKPDVRNDMKETGEAGVAKQIARPGTDPLIVKTKEKLDKEREVKEAKETKEEHNAEEELNFILKRSPIIIFSKTYCPFSRKAKDILLKRYTITPVPYVVELDTHATGSDLQAQLAKITGRNTVPNVLVNGVSIGGGDDIEDLHVNGGLVKKIASLAGQKVIVKPK